MDDSVPAPAADSQERRRRMMLAAAGLLAAAALGWLALTRGAMAPVPLPAGVDVRSSLEALRSAGIEATVEGTRGLVVPQGQLSAAVRAVEGLSQAPPIWADEWERASARLSQFASSRERDAAEDMSRARMIARRLMQMPGIAEADVVWDEDSTSDRRRPPRVRCTVYLKPMSGRDITPALAQAVRCAVAGSKHALATNDIVVLDLEHMIAFEAAPAGVTEAQRLHAEECAHELRQAVGRELRESPAVRATVSIAWRPSSADVEDSWRIVSLNTPRLAGGPNQRAALAAHTRERPRNWPAAEFGPGWPVAADETLALLQPHFQISVEADDDAWLRPPAARTTDELAKAPLDPAGVLREELSGVLADARRAGLSTGLSVHLRPSPAGAALTAARVLSTAAPPVTVAQSFRRGPRLAPMGLLVGLSLAGAWLLSTCFRRRTAAPAGALPASETDFVHGEGLSSPLDPHAASETWPAPSLLPLTVAATEPSALQDFEDLAHEPAWLWRALYSRVAAEDWRVALRAASQLLRRSMCDALSDSEAAQLLEGLDRAPPPRLAEIDASHARVLDAARRLLDSRDQLSPA